MEMNSPTPNQIHVINPPLEQYIFETSGYPNEHEQLKEIRLATVEKYKAWSMMNVAVDEAQFLSMMLKLMNAKNTLEVGVFTGYSLLTTALALPHDAKITAIDPDKEAYEVGLPFIKKAGVEHKIDFIHGPAMPFLNELIEKGKEGIFDFVFVDAEKQRYMEYHEVLLKLVKVGGVIGYDNTLWFGSLAFPDEVELWEGRDMRQKIREYMRKFNAFLASDPRIESTLLSLGDGLTLCRRKY